MSEANVIRREDMFQPLLEADPSFRSTWESFFEDWKDEVDKPQYLALGDLARHLIEQLAGGDTARFDAVFGVVERWHLQGEHYVREAAAVGLLEDLQNTGLHTRTRPVDFEQWLRPESKRWWRKVERLWSHGELLTED